MPLRAAAVVYQSWRIDLQGWGVDYMLSSPDPALLGDLPLFVAAAACFLLFYDMCI